MRPVGSYSPDKLSFDDPRFHRNHAVIDSSLQLPPVEASRRLSSSPNTLQPSTSISSDLFPAQALETLAINNMDLTQMQTPPPTRDSSKRKSQQAYAAALNTPTIASRRIIAPDSVETSYPGSTQTQQSPFPLANLQFSPGMLPFNNTGPATAPVYGQHKPMWEHNDSLSTMHMDWSSAFGNSFSAAPQETLGQMAWQDLSTSSNLTTNVQRPITASQSSPGWTQANTSKPNINTTSGFVPESPVTTGVDPSLLMSFSDPIIDAASVNKPIASNPTASTFSTSGRKPYEQQSQELKRDRDVDQSRKARQQVRNGTSSFNASKGSIRPGLARANTVGGFKSSGRGTLTAAEPVARTSSPLKRQSQGSLASIPERRKSQRRSVVLTVDENGRASTETKILAESSSIEPRQKYSSLWDDDSSESDPDDVSTTRSRHSSFTFGPSFDRSNKPPRPTSKDVASIPRSSSTFSNFTSWPSQSMSQSNSSRISWGSVHSDRYSGSMSSSAYGDVVKENSGRSDTPSGDAHAALREAMEGRVRKHGS